MRNMIKILLVVTVIVVGCILCLCVKKYSIEHTKNMYGNIIIVREDKLNELIQENSELFITIAKKYMNIDHDGPYFYINDYEMQWIIDNSKNKELVDFIIDNKEELLYLQKQCNIVAISHYSKIETMSDECRFSQKLPNFPEEFVELGIVYNRIENKLYTVNGTFTTKWWIKLYNFIYN